MNTPTPSKIRVSVPVSPEVLARFRRLSKVAGQSVGRAMSEWLEETQEGLDPMIEILERNKKAPLQAVRMLQAYSSTLDNATRELFDQVARMDETNETLAAAAGSARLAREAVKSRITPPSSNTGGKLPKNTKSSGGAN